MTLHTIGDSHSGFGWSGIVQHHLGALLCYSFGKGGLDRCDIRNFNIQDGDTVIFCLGEIDCRCHIHKHINETNTYQTIIDNIVKNYFDTIQLNIETAGIKLKTVGVYNVVPPVRKESSCENSEYPFLGSDEERKAYVLYFNKKLKEGCAEKGYLFFDVYDLYTDSDGFLNRELSDGHVHIEKGIHISNFMWEHDL